MRKKLRNRIFDYVVVVLFLKHLIHQFKLMWIHPEPHSQLRLVIHLPPPGVRVHVQIVNIVQLGQMYTTVQIYILLILCVPFVNEVGDYGLGLYYCSIANTLRCAFNAMMLSLTL
jgi:hypothetical protein